MPNSTPVRGGLIRFDDAAFLYNLDFSDNAFCNEGGSRAVAQIIGYIKLPDILEPDSEMTLVVPDWCSKIKNLALPYHDFEHQRVHRLFPVFKNLVCSTFEMYCSPEESQY